MKEEDKKKGDKDKFLPPMNHEDQKKLINLEWKIRGARNGGLSKDEWKKK